MLAAHFDANVHDLMPVGAEYLCFIDRSETRPGLYQITGSPEALALMRAFGKRPGWPQAVMDDFGDLVVVEGEA